MSQLQFVFGNPSKRKRKASVRKKIRRKKNPQRFVASKKGAKVKKGDIHLTIAEKNSLDSSKKSIEGELKALHKKSKGLRGANRKKVDGLLANAKGANRKLRADLKKATANMKKAIRDKNELKAKGYKIKLVKLQKEGEKKLKTKIKSGLKKIDTTVSKLEREVKVAKKRKKKATRKKAIRKKATRKKAVRKKVTRKKVTRKKATRKKATRKKATRKKATRKKASKKKSTRKKSRRKARRKKPSVNFGTFKKRISKATSKKGIGKGKKRKYKVKKRGRKYNVSVKRYKKNPMFGGNMKLGKFLRHDVAEVAGLALGGLSHGTVNDLVGKFLPGLAGNIQRVLGSFSGSFFPLVSGVLLGMGADKSKGKLKEYGSQVAKGLIGSAFVGLGATGYEMIRPSLGMSGLVQQNSALSGEYNQMGEDESDYMIGARRGYMDGEHEQMGAVASSDFDWTSSYTEEPYDFGNEGEQLGVEFESFEGENEQLG